MLPQLKLDAPAVAELLTHLSRKKSGKPASPAPSSVYPEGVDSALSATLAVRALGAENVHCVMMPYRSSSPESVEHAGLVEHSSVCEPSLSKSRRWWIR
jgi:hypothetical protein